MMERIQKLLAQSGIASRRKAEELIKTGHVVVNGVQASLGQKANLERDTILIDGKPIKRQSRVVFMLNKPPQIVSSVQDEQGRQTVVDLVPQHHRLYPIGRLDRMSEGLILLTNDGQLAHQLTHPKFVHEKEYEVHGTSAIAIPALAARLQQGVSSPVGFIRPDRVTFSGVRRHQLVFRIVVHEGRNHLIRRLCTSLGFEITRLIRRRIGQLSLGSLAPGEFRELSEQEIRRLPEK